MGYYLRVLAEFPEALEWLKKHGWRRKNRIAQFQKVDFHLQFPDLQPYVQDCRFSKAVRGKAWLMPSGKKDEVYNSKRIAVNWEDLYASGLGEPFVANWRAAVQRHYKPDYVFVDSRTGLTDVGGVCTLHLPDLVVLLFGLNEQNLHGIAAVLQTIRAAPTPRPPQILPVATPVPNLSRDEDGLLKTRFVEAEKLLGLKIECSISYNPQAALIEKLFTLDAEPRLRRIGGEYADLLLGVQKRDENGLDSLIRKAVDACENDDEATANQIRQALLDDFGDRADALFHVGQIDRLFRNREEAIAWWHKAVEVEPTHQPAFDALVNQYRLKKQFDEVVRLYDGRLDHMSRFDPDALPALHRDRGEQLMVIGRYSDAACSYKESLDASRNLEADFRLVTLFHLAEADRRSSGNANVELCKQVIELWERDITLENDPLTVQANKLQAIHIPYACLGKLSTARELLERAKRCASAVGKAEKLFCVKTYTYLPVDDFLDANAGMQVALQTNRLWDGMFLPVSG